MRVLTIAAAILLSVPIPAAAQRAPASRLTDAQLNDSLELGQEIESRVDGDLNGDGLIDTAYVAGSPDARTVTVLIAQRPGAKTPFRSIGDLKLEPSPLGPATVSIAKGVLKVEDLTGGGTAISAIYRFRIDPGQGKGQGRMRLIGLDATLYSRTYAHDGYEMSWNLLTSDIVTRDLRLNKGGGDAAYDKVFEHRSRRPSKPLYMEDTPDPEMIMVDLRKR
ncbi:hypothetical protein G4G27_01380 [Sphingomonas sp. So64.6b]|uniref:hypothetical protein n=1 Tax=Sphingomonas sp. So64.6b TaxID=2997354 RepID=UPI0016006089|nr:hypothetical protein [Sphingomonas sp. So64.6b]QNA82812.1 hypothetical protein G4G27_01380 [Sphingomonas sp. So64.6b]